MQSWGFRCRTTTYSLIYIRPRPYVFVEQIKKDGFRPQSELCKRQFSRRTRNKTDTEKITRIDRFWRVSSHAFTLPTRADIVVWRWFMYLIVSLTILQQNKITNKNEDVLYEFAKISKKLAKDLAIRRCELQDYTCAKETKILNANLYLKSYWKTNAVNGENRP